MTYCTKPPSNTTSNLPQNSLSMGGTAYFSMVFGNHLFRLGGGMLGEFIQDPGGGCWGAPPIIGPWKESGTRLAYSTSWYDSLMSERPNQNTIQLPLTKLPSQCLKYLRIGGEKEGKIHSKKKETTLYTAVSLGVGSGRDN